MQTSRSDTRPTDSLVTQQSTAASVIIPAYNEAASISRCLSALLQDAGPQEFEVIVVCNGCNDDTAELARKFGPMVRVIEIEEGSKIVALGLGNTAARFYPRLYLDADLEVSTMSARRLVAAVADDEAFAAIGRMELELSGVGWLLRQYYAVWSHHGYLRNGKFGGIYALSKQGCRHVGVLPRVINDDEYVRRSIPPDRVRYIESCVFSARMPRRWRDLYRVRRRVHQGNRQLDSLLRTDARSPSEGSFPLFTMLTRPWLWPGLATYIVLNALARRRSPSAVEGWERDESTRDGAASAQS